MKAFSILHSPFSILHSRITKKMKIKTILIDDEPGSLKALHWELEPHFAEIEIVAECDSPEKGLAAIRSLRPGLVFLDIEMPGMNGFELLRQLEGERDFSVIFITAYDEFAIQAFRVNAVDYLLKPIAADELKQALEKVKTKLGSSDVQKEMGRFLASISPQKIPGASIALPTQEGLDFIQPSQVTHCRSDGNYTRIFQTGEKPLLISRTLKEVEEMLTNPSFFRVHHSFLVNLVFVKKYLRGNSPMLILRDGTEVPVARRRKDELLKRLVSGE